MHTCADLSTTSKLSIVCDAPFGQVFIGISLNDQLLLGTTVHNPLTDVLSRLHCYLVVIATDIEKIYHVVLLPESQHDLQWLVWHNTSKVYKTQESLQSVCFITHCKYGS